MMTNMIKKQDHGYETSKRVIYSSKAAVPEILKLWIFVYNPTWNMDALDIQMVPINL